VSYVLNSWFFKKNKKKFYVNFILTTFIKNNVLIKIFNYSYFLLVQKLSFAFKTIKESLVFFINFFLKTKKNNNKLIQSIIFFYLNNYNKNIIKSKSYYLIQNLNNVYFVNFKYTPLNRKNYLFKFFILFYFIISTKILSYNFNKFNFHINFLFNSIFVSKNLLRLKIY
jgi:hypothetical protein